MLFLGLDMDKSLAAPVTYSIDGAAPQPLRLEGNRPPLATKLPPGKHHLVIKCSGLSANPAAAAPAAQPGATPWPNPMGQPPAKFSVWGIGSAGI